jgi:hypothetical protein
MAEHVLIVEAGVPVAGVQKTTIRTFTIKGEEENEGLYPRISFLDVVPHNMPRSVSSTSDNGHYVALGLARRNAIRTDCVVREGRCRKIPFSDNALGCYRECSGESAPPWTHARP